MSASESQQLELNDLINQRKIDFKTKAKSVNKLIFYLPNQAYRTRTTLFAYRH